jgi:hypothetical protein
MPDQHGTPPRPEPPPTYEPPRLVSLGSVQNLTRDGSQAANPTLFSASAPHP